MLPCPRPSTEHGLLIRCNVGVQLSQTICDGKDCFAGQGTRIRGYQQLLMPTPLPESQYTCMND